MLVRPEDIEVGMVQTGWGEATVTRRSFLGERVHLTLNVKDQSELFADVDTYRVEANFVGTGSIYNIPADSTIFSITNLSSFFEV